LVAAPERAARKLRRDIGFLGLLFASLGSIIVWVPETRFE